MLLLMLLLLLLIMLYRLVRLRPFVYLCDCEADLSHTYLEPK